MAGIRNDDDVLAAIFNPEFPLGLDRAGYGPAAPKEQQQQQQQQQQQHQQQQQQQVDEAERGLRAREVDGARKAEAGQLDEALRIFTEVIEADPGRASGYNNRAQALQFLGRPDEALADLDLALALPGISDDVARKAHFQRAMVRRVRGDPEGARRDFEAAARLGDELARREAALLNPYAAMCNQMLASVMSTWKEGKATMSAACTDTVGPPLSASQTLESHTPPTRTIMMIQ